jgi:hypothetical protein
LQTRPSVQAAYQGYSGAPSGSWAYLPGIRKNVGNLSTGFTLMNTQPSSQTYQILYWDQSGAFVKADNLTVPGYASWFYAQEYDAGLPNGFDGSVQITNTTSGGAPPATVVEVYAGYPSSYTTGVTPPPTPTVTATLTPARRKEVRPHHRSSPPSITRRSSSREPASRPGLPPSLPSSWALYQERRQSCRL